MKKTKEPPLAMDMKAEARCNLRCRALDCARRADEYQQARERYWEGEERWKNKFERLKKMSPADRLVALTKEGEHTGMPDLYEWQRKAAKEIEGGIEVLRQAHISTVAEYKGARGMAVYLGLIEDNETWLDE